VIDIIHYTTVAVGYLLSSTERCEWADVD